MVVNNKNDCEFNWINMYFVGFFKCTINLILSSVFLVCVTKSVSKEKDLVNYEPLYFKHWLSKTSMYELDLIRFDFLYLMITSFVISYIFIYILM